MTEHLANDMAHSSPKWATGSLALPDGKLGFRHIGSGPTLIGLHGIQGTSDVWSDVAQFLSPSYTVVVPDMRGREPSMIPPSRDDYGMDRFAADLESLVVETGDPAILIGWSMGVLVLLEYLRNGGSKPSALVLVSGSACLGHEAQWFRGDSAAEVAEEAVRRAKRLQLSRAAAPEAVAASWWHARQCDYRDSLTAISCPTLVLHGADDDQCPPRHADVLASKLPEARLEVWEDCGHNPMAHDARRFAASLHTFSQELARARERAP